VFPDVSNDRIIFMNTVALEQVPVKAARYFETSRIAQQRSVTSQNAWNSINLIL
jgi:hypothetical protein